MKRRRLLLLGLALLGLGNTPFSASAKQADDPAVTLGLLRYERPSFPLLASSEGVFEGSAWIAVEWDDEGSARDVLVLSTTHPAIGRAVAEAVSSWRRDPARREIRNDDFIVKFEVDGIVLVSSAVSTKIPSAFPPKLTPVARRTELDDEPRALHQPMPSLAPAGGKPSTGGRVVVSFYVDEEGRVRAPKIEEAGSPDFAAATLETLRQWRYEPARRQGRPTIYVDTWVFDFNRR